jgi:Xaa-Pro dipeptidase
MAVQAAWQHPVPRIGNEERQERLKRLRALLDEAGIDALLLGSTESLRYFTGLVWHGSERFCGALVTRDSLRYIVPGFECSRVETLPRLPGEIVAWQEEEEPMRLVASLLRPGSVLALDEQIPLFQYHRLVAVFGADRLRDGGPLVSRLRMRKSGAEIAIIRHAMGLTLGIHERVRANMRPGLTASEVVAFIDAEHRRLGADDGSTFAIVSFGAATALPHGADGEQTLGDGDVILVDTGCRLDGYHSDLTRTYVLGKPAPDVERIWRIEQEAQDAVFEAARVGATCSSLDRAARDVLARHGLGPDYRLPGLPHRAGHGLGLEIHEAPYIVRNNETRLEPGMCFSVEPMIVVPNRFGVRLEDHVFMTDAGPEWFTAPDDSPSARR